MPESRIDAELEAAALETPGALIGYDESPCGGPTDYFEVVVKLGSCREAWTGLVGRPVKTDKQGVITPYKKVDVYEFLLPIDDFTAVPLLQVCFVPVQVINVRLLGTLSRVTPSEIACLEMYLMAVALVVAGAAWWQ
jgi:hypothetical protein